MSLFTVVGAEERMNIFYKSGRKRPRRSDIHKDIYQSLAHLAAHRHDVVKIFAGDKSRWKQHVAHLYAGRHKLKIATLIREGWLFIRLKDAYVIQLPVPEKKMVPPSFLVTTAAEMRKYRRKA